MLGAWAWGIHGVWNKTLKEDKNVGTLGASPAWEDRRHHTEAWRLPDCLSTAGADYDGPLILQFDLICCIL